MKQPWAAQKRYHPHEGLPPTHATKPINKIHWMERRLNFPSTLQVWLISLLILGGAKKLNIY